MTAIERAEKAAKRKYNLEVGKFDPKWDALRPAYQAELIIRHLAENISDEMVEAMKRGGNMCGCCIEEEIKSGLSAALTAAVEEVEG